MNPLVWICVGMIAGWITGRALHISGGKAALADMALGAAAAIAGGWVMRALGFTGLSGTAYTLAVAIEYAVVLTVIIHLNIGRRGKAIQRRLTDRSRVAQAESEWNKARPREVEAQENHKRAA